MLTRTVRSTADAVRRTPARSATRTATALLLGFTALAALTTAHAQDREGPVDPVREHLNLAKDGLALDGYDPVAYFPEGGGEPKKGAKTRTVEYRGATYRFANDANRERFRAEPSRFAPAFGGWCAYAMASDDRVEIDPESFLIEDGSLLVFFDGFFADTRKSWKKEGPEKLRPKADGFWNSFADEPRHRDTLGYAHADGLALGGYDPVAYFEPNEIGAIVPLAGDAKLAVTERGLTYRFASAANRDAFLRAPSVHEPAFGGWDPLRLIAGEAVTPDPDRFAHTAAGRVVLFAAPADGAADPVEAWNADRSALETRAAAAYAKHVADLMRERAGRAAGR